MGSIMLWDNDRYEPITKCNVWTLCDIIAGDWPLNVRQQTVLDLCLAGF